MKRSAKYIGSPLWRAQQLSVYRSGTTTTALDKPSGIYVRYYVPVDEGRIISELAHRVRQLTT